jgi:hypothetical protein
MTTSRQDKAGAVADEELPDGVERVVELFEALKDALAKKGRRKRSAPAEGASR